MADQSADAGYQSARTGEEVEASLDLADSALQPGDVDDTPVDGATDAPVSSNWAHDHAAATQVHGISAFGATLVDDADASTARGTLGLGDSATLNVGTIAGTVAAGNDSRLSDARSPTAHSSTHQSGGADAIKLDDLAAPDDNTDLDATTSAHGLLPKLGGGTADFLRADGTWATPPDTIYDGDIADIDLDGGTDIGADLADADLILVDDGAAGANRKSALSRVWTYISAKIAALTDISGWASVLDEDDMSSDSSTQVPTQQSVKAYADTKADAAPAWTTLTGSPTVPLDGGSYEYQIPDSSTETLAVTLPANDAASKQYGAYLKITAPASGGPETVAIPSGWGKLGPLDAISLTAGDEPIIVILSTDNDSDTTPTVQFTAQQREVMP